jgi:carboxyl-terminal processing protease
MKKKWLVCLLVLVGVATAQEVVIPREKLEKSLKQLEVFNKALFLIESQYYREINDEQLIQGAIRGMLDTLDPHSMFLSKDMLKKMQDDTKGEFGGVGIEISQKEGGVFIIGAIEDTPAFEAGVKPGDRIVEINGKSSLGWRMEDTVEAMRGKIGDFLKIGVRREGSEKTIHFSLLRKVIKINPVKSDVIEDHFAYVKLKQFQKNSAEKIAKAIDKIEKKNLEGIILDLRGNPGGLLDEAVDVSSLFLETGTVVSTEARDPSLKDIRYVKKSGAKYLKTPMVVLVNAGSASASEIVAGALQDYKRAIIMGVQTFGKGTVQSVIQIDENNALKLTISQYLTPKGRSIQAVGITPDIEVDEFDPSIMLQETSKKKNIRESDLKNHVIGKQESAAGSVGKSHDLVKKDFQVMQAVNFLKSFDVFKHMKL